MYTLHGGIKARVAPRLLSTAAVVCACNRWLVGVAQATFISDYLHTALIFAIILTFGFTVYVSSPLIGSPKAMHAMLASASLSKPVHGNKDGQYMTMASSGGLIFGLINVVGNLGTVFCDQVSSW